MIANMMGLGALMLVVATGTLWFRRALRVALPEDRSAFVAAMASGAALGALALAWGVGWMAAVAAQVAIFFGMLFVALVAISAQRGGSGAFVLERAVPTFSAPDDEGNDFDLSSLAGKPLLLKFFRGHW